MIRNGKHISHLQKILKRDKEWRLSKGGTADGVKYLLRYIDTRNKLIYSTSVCNLILEEDATNGDEQLHPASDSKMRPETNLGKLFT